ncbi:MAG: hypothetical protein HKN76_03310 [Saprospiraceae bacterium]|nr:hypothetical protein [Saprospiraceae bacterium]
MKSHFLLILMTLAAFSIPNLSQAENYNDDWECYSSNNYRGGKKMIKAGEYDNCSSWRYYSWKSNCCVKLHFYYRDNKKGEKILCGNVRDLKYEMKKWGNLKYGWQNPWKNVYKAVFYCNGGDNYADNNKGHNNNGHNNNNNAGKVDKGYVYFYNSDNCSGKYQRVKAGNINWKNWRYESCRIADGCALIVHYYNRHGQKKYKEFKGDVKRLYDAFRQFGCKNSNPRWSDACIIGVEIYCGDNYRPGKDYANNNQDNHNNGGNNKGGNYNDLLRKGQCVGWQGSNYAQNYEGYMPGKKYYPRNLKDKFWSLHCPDNYEVFWVYKDRRGKLREDVCKGKIGDLRGYFGRWDIQDRNRAWDYIQYFEIRKAGMGGNNNGNKDDYDYRKKPWYGKFRNGYIIFTEYKYYDGKYQGKVPGDYDYRKIGFYPRSIGVPSSSIYCVIEWRAANGKRNSEVIKKDIPDLDKFLMDHGGVYKDYKQYPYKALSRIAVIRQ